MRQRNEEQSKVNKENSVISKGKSPLITTLSQFTPSTVISGNQTMSDVSMNMDTTMISQIST